ncbi:MAG: hypothetical protein AB7E55_33895 [Pigmentiphaga sp.]
MSQGFEGSVATAFTRVSAALDGLPPDERDLFLAKLVLLLCERLEAPVVVEAIEAALCDSAADESLLRM